jgi:hypothetical protein
VQRERQHQRHTRGAREDSQADESAGDDLIVRRRGPLQHRERGQGERQVEVLAPQVRCVKDREGRQRRCPRQQDGSDRNGPRTQDPAEIGRDPEQGECRIEREGRQQRFTSATDRSEQQGIERRIGPRLQHSGQRRFSAQPAVVLVGQQQVERVIDPEPSEAILDADPAHEQANRYQRRDEQPPAAWEGAGVATKRGGGNRRTHATP